MDRLQWITHKDKKILYINYSNLKCAKPEEEKLILDTIKKARDLSADSKEKIRFLSDVTNSSASKVVMQALKEFAAFTAANKKTEKECVVGISGVQKILLSAINMFAQSKLEMFDNVEQAKDWLVS
jgi:hypothetical protein